MKASYADAYSAFKEWSGGFAPNACNETQWHNWCQHARPSDWTVAEAQAFLEFCETVANEG